MNFTVYFVGSIFVRIASLIVALLVGVALYCIMRFFIQLKKCYTKTEVQIKMFDFALQQLLSLPSAGK